MIAYKSVILLVPDGLRNEIFNIGIILECEDHINWTVYLPKIHLIKKYFYPDLSLSLINNILNDLDELLKRLKTIGTVKDIYNIYNGIIRFTEFKGLITDDIEKEMSKLLNLYVNI